MGVDIVILAAGKGTRMKSQVPKVLHKVCNKPMLWHILTVATKVSDRQSVVVGYGKDQVTEFLSTEFVHNDLSIVEQEQQLGTGHAVACAKDQLKNEHTMILLGDTPLISETELSGLVEYHTDHEAAITVLTGKMDDPHGYGRILRDNEGVVKQIVEESDASEREKNITEINTGIMLFKTEELLEVLENLKTDNQQGEYYLTDAISILYSKGKVVSGYQVDEVYRTMGINDRSELSKAEQLMKREINTNFMKAGVTIIDPDNTYIDPKAIIGRDTLIYPGTQIYGNTEIGADCVLGSDSVIINSKIDDGCQVEKSKIDESIIGAKSKIGPFAHIRPKSELSREVKIGNFVEVKNSKIGTGSKANHLAYVGDANIGKEVNLGAGTVVVNYDGTNKHKTVIEDGAFVGCNSNLVAPVTVSENAFVAAGSTITDDVPENSLAIARSRQTNKIDWVNRQKDS